MSNSFKGLGDIRKVARSTWSNQPTGMFSLDTQYRENLNNIWPNSNTTMIISGAMSQAPYLQSYAIGGQQDGSYQQGLDYRFANNSIGLAIAGQANDVSWEKTGTYIAVAHATTPYVTICKKTITNNWYPTLTKLSNPATLPPATGNGVEFSQDGIYLAVAHNTTPFVTVYKRSGDTFTKLTNPATLPASSGFGVSWSPSGTYLAVAHAVTPFVTIYKLDKTTDTLTKLSNPATLPPSTGARCAWSPDEGYLAVAHTSTPFVTIYQRSGDTFTKVANPSTLPASVGNDVSFSPDGRWLAVAHNNTPYCSLYDTTGGGFTYVSISSYFGTLPTGTGQSVVFSKDSNILYIGHTTSPFLTLVGGLKNWAGGGLTSYFFDTDITPVPLGTLLGIDVY
jgi:Lactonase, 7-bladed beta-propeller